MSFLEHLEELTPIVYSFLYWLGASRSAGGSTSIFSIIRKPTLGAGRSPGQKLV